jgi:hypothetical protein
VAILWFTKKFAARFLLYAPPLLILYSPFFLIRIPRRQLAEQTTHRTQPSRSCIFGAKTWVCSWATGPSYQRAIKYLTKSTECPPQPIKTASCTFIYFTVGCKLAKPIYYSIYTCVLWPHIYSAFIWSSS